MGLILSSCKYCQYNENCNIKNCPQVMEALDKQNPDKVCYSSKLYYDEAECPKCGYLFSDNVDGWHSKYCPNCGQKLDWTNYKNEKKYK